MVLRSVRAIRHMLLSDEWHDIGCQSCQVHTPLRLVNLSLSSSWVETFAFPFLVDCCALENGLGQKKSYNNTH